MLKKVLLLTLLLLNIGYTKDNIVVYNAYGNNHQLTREPHSPKSKRPSWERLPLS